MSIRKGTNKCESAQHGLIYQRIRDMNTCEYMYVYNNVLGVSTCKGTNICQLAQHGFIYKSICDGIYVYLRALARAQTYM